MKYEDIEAIHRALSQDAEWLFDEPPGLPLSLYSAPDRIWIPIRTFWEILQYPVIAKMQKRRGKRPRFAMRVLGYSWRHR